MFRAQPGSVANWRYVTFVRGLGEAAAPGGGSAGRAGHLPYNWRKSRKTLSQGNRMALGWSAPNAIRLVDLAIAGEDLDWSAVPCGPWRQATGSTLGQLTYLPSCRDRGVPHISQLWVKALGQGSDVVDKQRNAQILVYLPVTYVPDWCCCLRLVLLKSNARTTVWTETWIVTPVASGYGCGQRTSTQGTHSPT